MQAVYCSQALALQYQAYPKASFNGAHWNLSQGSTYPITHLQLFYSSLVSSFFGFFLVPSVFSHGTDPELPLHSLSWGLCYG